MPIATIEGFMCRYRTDDIEKRRSRFFLVCKAELLGDLAVLGLRPLSSFLSLSGAASSSSCTAARREIDNILNSAPCEKFNLEDFFASGASGDTMSKRGSDAGP